MAIVLLPEGKEGQRIRSVLAAACLCWALTLRHTPLESCQMSTGIRKSLPSMHLVHLPVVGVQTAHSGSLLQRQRAPAAGLEGENQSGCRGSRAGWAVPHAMMPVETSLLNGDARQCQASAAQHQQLPAHQASQVLVADLNRNPSLQTWQVPILSQRPQPLPPLHGTHFLVAAFRYQPSLHRRHVVWVRHCLQLPSAEHCV